MVCVILCHLMISFIKLLFIGWSLLCKQFTSFHSSGNVFTKHCHLQFLLPPFMVSYSWLPLISIQHVSGCDVESINFKPSWKSRIRIHGFCVEHGISNSRAVSLLDLLLLQSTWNETKKGRCYCNFLFIVFSITDSMLFVAVTQCLLGLGFEGGFGGKK